MPCEAFLSSPRSEAPTHHPRPLGSAAHLLVFLIQILQKGVQLILINVATSILVGGGEGHRISTKPYHPPHDP